MNRELKLILVAAALLGTTADLHAQAKANQARATPVEVSKVITAFLVDSGVMTRGLPWTTGTSLPIKWQPVEIVTNPAEVARRQGITHTKSGTFTGTAGDSVALPMSITVTGTAAGLAGMSIEMSNMEVTKKDGSGFFTTREMIEAALRNEGLTLTPIKCSRDKEGASYGSLVDAVKAPGKTASGLAWHWESPQQQMYLTLSLLYRRADMAKVECQS